MSVTDKHSRRLGMVLNLPMVIFIVFLALIPLLFEMVPRLESRFFPVVENLIDDNDTPDTATDDTALPLVAAEYPSTEVEEAYVDVFVQFDKVRNCDFLIEETVVQEELVRRNRSLTWYDGSGRRLRIEFEPEDIDLPSSRPRGEQVAGPWRLYGTRTTEGTTAIVAHRCHPLWLTYSQFHP